MKSIKYLNAVLTVIAFCLVVITLAITGVIQTVKAEPKSNSGNFTQIPINPDGSINVTLKTKDVLDVNIETCSSNAFYYAQPIEVRVRE